MGIVNQLTPLINKIKGDIGKLVNLHTIANTSLVDAINEVNSIAIAGGGGGISNITSNTILVNSNSTTKTFNLEVNIDALLANSNTYSNSTSNTNSTILVLSNTVNDAYNVANNAYNKANNAYNKANSGIIIGSNTLYLGNSYSTINNLTLSGNSEVKQDLLVDGNLYVQGYNILNGFGAISTSLNDLIGGTFPKLVGGITLSAGSYAAPIAYIGCTSNSYIAILRLKTANGNILANVGYTAGGLSWKTANSGFTLGVSTNVDFTLESNSIAGVAMVKGLVINKA